MATVATISVNFAQYDSLSFTPTGVIDRSINPRTLSQYCLGTTSGDFSYLGGFVKKTGDNMSGYLTLPTANPTLADHATRKGYVDSRIDSLSATVNSTGAGGFVRISGSTMVGDLILNTSSPSVALQASSKGYVDTRINSLSSTVDTKLMGEYLARAGGTMLGAISMNSNKIVALGTPTLATDAATKGYVDGAVTTATTDAATKTYVNQQDALKVTKAGDTMGGRLGQAVEGFHSAHRDNITTRIDSGFYQTNTAKKSTGWPADTNGWYHLLTSTHYNDNNYYSMQFASQFDNSNELYYRSTNDNGNVAWNKIFHSGNTNTLSLIGYLPVNKGGDTMLGFLSLHSNPTENAHAANKAYVDAAVSGANSAASTSSNTKVSKSGDTMTGFLSLHANPTATSHAANKAYVDTGVTSATAAAAAAQTSANTGIANAATAQTSANTALSNAANAAAGANAANTNANNRVLRTGDTMTGSLAVQGTITATGDVTAFSDIRIKKNINDIDNALDKVLKLKGVTFERLSDNKKSLGVIAQDVLSVIPEVVREEKDGYLSVAYGNIVGVLIEAIKELNSKIEILENKNK